MEISISTLAVVVRDGELLLARDSSEGPSEWTLPEVQLHTGEDPSDAVVRGIRESTGCTANVDGPLGIDSEVVPAPRDSGSVTQTGTNVLRIFYRASVATADGSRPHEELASGGRWVRLADVARLVTNDVVERGVRLLVESAR
jgi:8-oxo-dGTP diphosphatase